MPMEGKSLFQRRRSISEKRPRPACKSSRAGTRPLCIRYRVGIPEGDLEKIFEPFIRKKPWEERYGIGNVGGLERRQGSRRHIAVDSIEGKGTTFTIHLPLTEEAETVSKYPDVQKDIRGPANLSWLWTISEISGKSRLSSSGEWAIPFTPLKARGSNSIFEPDTRGSAGTGHDHGTGMDGLETYQKILEIYPKQKAIIASGYSETLRVRRRCLWVREHI